MSNSWRYAGHYSTRFHFQASPPADSAREICWISVRHHHHVYAMISSAALRPSSFQLYPIKPWADCPSRFPLAMPWFGEKIDERCKPNNLQREKSANIDRCWDKPYSIYYVDHSYDINKEINLYSSNCEARCV